MESQRINRKEADMAKPTREELEARVKELEAQQEEANRMTYKVSPKGGVSVYGLGRFPVTLYREQWERLLADADNLRAFIKSNAPHLKKKGS
jgi:hypothetical protein